MMPVVTPAKGDASAAWLRLEGLAALIPLNRA
jgi:hypothetical protein